MPRWVRWLLTILAGAIGALASGLGAIAVVAGVAWIFVFGDDPWPGWAEPAIMTIAILIALILGAIMARSTWLWTAPPKSET